MDEEQEDNVVRLDGVTKSSESRYVLEEDTIIKGARKKVRASCEGRVGPSMIGEIDHHEACRRYVSLDRDTRAA